jgi:heterodisulfide reductase subunit C
MTITNLTTMGESEEELRDKLRAQLERIGENIPDMCYQCGKCTSGCEAMKLLELEPHNIMAMVKAGFIEELINSDIIWTCVTCFKCKERCPQKAAPVEVLFLLKNMAVVQGKEIPINLSNMFQNVLTQGVVQMSLEVRTRAGEGVKREDLGLPELQLPKDPAKFQNVLMKLAMEEV